jgi:hypothetical protein
MKSSDMMGKEYLVAAIYYLIDTQFQSLREM